MSDAALGHDRNGDGSHDLPNDLGRSHAGYAAFGADLRGDAFEGHDGDGAGVFGDGGLGGSGDVHDDAAFEHFGEAGLEAEAGGVTVVLGHRLGPFRDREGWACNACNSLFYTEDGGFTV